MDSTRFDSLVKVFGTLSRRRATLALLSTLGLGGLLGDDLEAKRRRKKKCKKKCGPCRKCKKGKCKPKPDGTECGGGATCQAGECICPTECCADADCGACATCDGEQCVSTCPDGQVCEGDTCVAGCPAGQKECQGVCIANAQCCLNADCPNNEVCCTNTRECTDTRNDPDFCGACTNHQCLGGAFCANGACSLQCNTIGDVCFQPDCKCGNRVDPAHDGENVCAEVISCDSATECTDDASCSPGTLGFGQVCASDICPGKNVCAEPCA